MKRILCYGDSNTWGYISGSDHLRYGNGERWTKILQNQLGNEFEVIEEGLNSRTLLSDDNRPGKEGRNGFTYFKPCMDTHDKIDLLLLMLATNELKYEFNNSVDNIVSMIEKYVCFVKGYKSQIDKSSPKLIMLGVPLVNEKSQYSKEKNKYKDAGIKSKQLNIKMKEYCRKENIYYIDNTDLQTGVDGVHLTRESHKILADKVYKAIKETIF